MKKIIITILLLGICIGSVQAQLNDYKYIIVPTKFDAFKRENQHLTSTLVKHLFAEKGYNAVYSDALPEEVNNNRCLALTAQIKDESTMFMTKTAIVLKDCQSQEVYTSQQGTSKEKEYKLSYGQAIRMAFRSFDKISYSYTPAVTESVSKPVTVSYKDDVKQLPETSTVATEKKEEVAAKVIVAEKESENQTTSEAVNSELEAAEQQKNKTVDNEQKEHVAAKVIVADKVIENETVSEATVQQPVTPQLQSNKNPEPQPSDKTKAAVATSVLASEKNSTTTEVWYAQEITSGFQLVDSSPKVRLKLYSTSLNNVYLSENENGQGLVYEKNGQWFLEYYEGANLKTEKLNLKF